MRWSPDFFVAMTRLLIQSVGLSTSQMSRESVSRLSSSSSFDLMAEDTPLEGCTLGSCLGVNFWM